MNKEVKTWFLLASRRAVGHDFRDSFEKDASCSVSGSSEFGAGRNDSENEQLCVLMMPHQSRSPSQVVCSLFLDSSCLFSLRQIEDVID